MTEEIAWKEVAAYLLTIEAVKNQKPKIADKRAFQVLFDSLRNGSITDIRDELQKYAGGRSVNRAAQRLLNCEDNYLWKKQTVKLESLRMSGGKEGTEFHEIAMRKHGGSPSPIHIGSEVKKGRLRDYIKGEKIPSFKRRIIVYQEKPGPNIFRIGDGYHRSVEVRVTHQEETIPCYVGYLR